jgi:hypothetical protein
VSEERDRELEERLRALPRSITPQKDLWSGIASRIETARPVVVRPRVWNTRAARWAAVGIVAAAAAVALVVRSDRAARTNAMLSATVVLPPPPIAPVAPMPAPAAPAAIVPEEDSYRTAMSALTESFARSRGNLPPATVRGVDASLKVIETAIAATRAALARDPGNADLRAQLGDEYQQAIDVLSDVVVLSTRT